jgi:hypothetical protein
MIPMLSELPQGAQVKIRQALGLLGEALIEIAGRDKDEATQADLFAPAAAEAAAVLAEPATLNSVSQAAPEPAEAAPPRTHGADEATESMDETMPDGRAVPGPDESLLPSSGSEPSQAEIDADLEREELIEIQHSEAHPSSPPDAAVAPDISSGAGAEDGAATPTAAPSVEHTENLPGGLNSASREPEAAAPAATEGEVAAEAAVSSPERRRQMIAEAQQAVALRTEVTRPRLREPVKTAMQPTSTDWVRLRHKDGRWLRMDGLDWLDAKSGKRENAYLCQRKQLPAVRSKFPLARECELIDEPNWSPKDITWARGNT